MDNWLKLKNMEKDELEQLSQDFNKNGEIEFTFFFLPQLNLAF